MRDWLPPGVWRRLKKEQMALEAEQARKAGRPLLTDEERAMLPIERQRQLGFNRWMELRFTGRVKALGLVVVGNVADHQHNLIEIDRSKRPPQF